MILTMVLCGISLLLNITILLGMGKLQAFGSLSRRNGRRSEKPNGRYLEGRAICNHVMLSSIQVKNSPLG
ncbi:hypothetical protein NA56DRAFT_388848 [Hyaloscypha hepaticicola]|uniref:Uncharacterized protein n=1 Tax=Hyaloscypha hepaticicola TaxID=2082293 RepID=A0A2J6QI09_9HELO|nr:hypothetical protein NA56DRAFT_388848 [Hyaloscypha hepaticicola]